MARNQSTNVNLDQGINRIVEGTVMEGTIRSENSIRVDGQFIGDIHTEGRLVIGVSGSIDGTVVCADCESEGRVKGQIHVAGLLSLKSTAEVDGDIRYGRMAVEEGARVQGVCKLDAGVQDLPEVEEPSISQVEDEGFLQQSA